MRNRSDESNRQCNYIKDLEPESAVRTNLLIRASNSLLGERKVCGEQLSVLGSGCNSIDISTTSESSYQPRRKDCTLDADRNLIRNKKH